MGCLKLKYHESETAIGENWIFFVDGIEKTVSSQKKCKDYYAYGWEMPGRRKNPNLLSNGYQGQFSEHDPETGLNEFILRSYDPRIGRWTTTDPYWQYFSPYVGMGNNPVNGVDPDGGIWGGYYEWLQMFRLQREAVDRAIAHGHAIDMEHRMLEKGYAWYPTTAEGAEMYELAWINTPNTGHRDDDTEESEASTDEGDKGDDDDEPPPREDNPEDSEKDEEEAAKEEVGEEDNEKDGLSTNFKASMTWKGTVKLRRKDLMLLVTK